MGHRSTPDFQTFHALRIKGFATVDTLVDMTSLDAVDVQSHLADLERESLAQFREARSLWQLTPDGRAAHPERLSTDLNGFEASSDLAENYDAFLALNTEFKALCGDWQLRDGDVNDHSDDAYDAAVIDRLVGLDQRAQPVVVAMGQLLDRLSPYGARLTSTVGRLQQGEVNMFTGVMCGSYHDAWMELHEDLILTQGIDRTAEGSF